MAEHTRRPNGVSLVVHQQGQYVYCSWTVLRPHLAGAPHSKPKQRVVQLIHPEPLSVPQLTVLAQRMAALVLSGARGTAHVRKGLPWREVGVTAWSVPPSGGEGGESLAHLVPQGNHPKVHEPLTEKGK